MVEIKDVIPGSIGDELELKAGDRLLAVNGKSLRDLLDYVIYTRDVESLLLDVRRCNGEEVEFEIEKDAEEDLGLVMEHPDPEQCGNSCIFCFVHQLPGKMRKTLYVKDEDYRFSYLYGAYVTLANISEADITRILEQKLSPLYVSVHTTDEHLRAQLLGRQDLPPLRPILDRLIQGGIEIHTQIVVCPGWNDGSALEKTVSDLVGFYPGVQSLAIVPVGLTSHRERLPLLHDHTPEEAQSVLALITRQQQSCLSHFQRRFVYAADEYYLKAGMPFPAFEDYEAFPQYENGVGLIPSFRREAEECLLEAKPLHPFAVDCVTGASFYPELVKYAAQLQDKTGVNIRVHRIDNRFFGGHVSVAGLLTGRDILESLRGNLQSNYLMIPDVVFRDGADVMLDNVTPEEIADALHVELVVVDSTPWGMLTALETVAEEIVD